jgi:hypothetical protein
VAAELAELRELARTAGVEPVAELVQQRARPDPRTYVGKGKLAELKEAFPQSNAESLIVDDELSPTQQRQRGGAGKAWTRGRRDDAAVQQKSQSRAERRKRTVHRPREPPSRAPHGSGLSNRFRRDNEALTRECVRLTRSGWRLLERLRGRGVEQLLG